MSAKGCEKPEQNGYQDTLLLVTERGLPVSGMKAALFQKCEKFFIADEFIGGKSYIPRPKGMVVPLHLFGVAGLLREISLSAGLRWNREKVR
jgi:hypothetical protein